MSEVIEVTGKILVEIRDEIKKTRKELQGEIKKTRKELQGEIKKTRKDLQVKIEDTNKHLGALTEDVSGIKADINAIWGFFQKDVIRLADRVERIEHKLDLPPMV